MSPAPTPLATLEQVAEWLQITPDQLKRKVRRGTGPTPIKLSRTEWRFAWADVHSWARSRRETSNGE